MSEENIYTQIAIRGGNLRVELSVEDAHSIRSVYFGASEDSADVLENLAWKMRGHMGVDPVRSMLEGIDAHLSKEQHLDLLKALVNRLKP